MFDPEVPREAMNFFERILFDISDKFVNWVELTFTDIAITEGLNNFIEKLKDIFGERGLAYGFVDLLDLIADIIAKV